MEQVMPSSSWNVNTLTFRFIFIYFVFYIFPFPLDAIPFSEIAWQWLSASTFNIVDAAYKQIQGIDYKPLVMPGGSGDTTYNYIQVFAFVVVAFVLTLIWSAIDRKRTIDDKLYYWLTILVRYYLAFTMINYGMFKIFKTQFPTPMGDWLMQSYGDSSPMRLLWTFMGFSTAYNVFVGLGEFFGGFLLLFRRTRLLGALLVIAVMSNVVMLNFTYDVPVKLFSMHLLLMAIYLTLPDAKRLLNFFALNKRVEETPMQPVYYNDKTRRAYLIAKGLLIGVFLFFQVKSQFDIQERMKEFYAKRSATPDALTGEFQVETFILAGDTLAGERDTRRWKKVTFTPRKAGIEYTDGASMDWNINSNAGYKRFVMVSTDISTIGSFRYQQNGDEVIARGLLNQDSIVAKLRRTSSSEFLLVSRGFHWVNEFPYNR
jgi:hypothetical protein